MLYFGLPFDKLLNKFESDGVEVHFEGDCGDGTAAGQNAALHAGASSSNARRAR
jgi:hypothetical protein